MSTQGSDFDTLLGIYLGPTVENLSEVLSNDDNSLSGKTSFVSFQAVGGVEYEVAVDGFGGESGHIILRIQMDVPEPPLSVMKSGGNIILSWPTNFLGLVLETSVTLDWPPSWTEVQQPPVIIGNQFTLKFPISTVNHSFRLKARPLRIGRSGGNVIVSWPISYVGFVVEKADLTGEALEWAPLTESPTILDNQNVIKLDATRSNQLLRLR